MGWGDPASCGTGWHGFSHRQTSRDLSASPRPCAVQKQPIASLGTRLLDGSPLCQDLGLHARGRPRHLRAIYYLDVCFAAWTRWLEAWLSVAVSGLAVRHRGPARAVLGLVQACCSQKAPQFAVSWLP